jgi:hypothetical protein
MSLKSAGRRRERSLFDYFFRPRKLLLRLGRKIESSTAIYFQLLCCQSGGASKKGRLKNGTPADGNSYFFALGESNCRSTAQMLPAGQKVSGAGVTPAHR